MRYFSRQTLVRAVARLLAVTLLVLGLMDPALAINDTVSECAPEWCVSLSAERHHAPLNAFTAFDLSDEKTDLEQLLRPQSNRWGKRPSLTDRYPAPAQLQPLAWGPPLLRPPIARS